MKPLQPYSDLKQSASERRRARYAQQAKRGVKKVSKGARFPDLVNKKLRAYVRSLDCVLKGLTDAHGRTHRCVTLFGTPTMVCHLKTRGSGGADENNIFPACGFAHSQQEGRTAAFEAQWGVRLKAVCRQVTNRWYREKGLV